MWTSRKTAWGTLFAIYNCWNWVHIHHDWVHQVVWWHKSGTRPPFPSVLRSSRQQTWKRSWVYKVLLWSRYMISEAHALHSWAACAALVGSNSWWSQPVVTWLCMVTMATMVTMVTMITTVTWLPMFLQQCLLRIMSTGITVCTWLAPYLTTKWDARGQYSLCMQTTRHGTGPVVAYKCCGMYTGDIVVPPDGSHLSSLIMPVTSALVIQVGKSRGGGANMWWSSVQ